MATCVVVDLYEALYTTRAMRRVRPDPIPQDAQARILDAAIRAPSGGNAQAWRFLLVDDRATKERLGPCTGKASPSCGRPPTANASLRRAQHRAPQVAFRPYRLCARPSTWPTTLSKLPFSSSRSRPGSPQAGRFFPRFGVPCSQLAEKASGRH